MSYDGSNYNRLTSGTSALQVKSIKHCNRSCIDCKHKVLDETWCCKHEPDRTFDNEDDYEICSMFEEKNIIFADDLPEPSEDELPF